jgi:hypothetical protein
MEAPETEQELIEEIRALNASIDVDESNLIKKKELRDKYLKTLSKSLGKLVNQMVSARS